MDEGVYATRILMNLSFTSEIRAENYKKIAVPISQFIYEKEDEVIK